ncbi:hypothetical protein B4Q13_21350, partial [Lacticaseibacillus rhamnosus]
MVRIGIIALDLATFGEEPRDWLLAHEAIPLEVQGDWSRHCELALARDVEKACDLLERHLRATTDAILKSLPSLPQMQARVTRTIASVDSEIRGSGTVSMRTSPAPYITVAFMKVCSC